MKNTFKILSANFVLLLAIIALFSTPAYAVKQVQTTDIANQAVTGPKIANSAVDLTTKVTGTLPAANGGTGQTSIANAFVSFYESVATTLGDLIYGGASGAPTRIAGNTTATPKFLKSLGSGGVATAPTWSQPACADLSNASASCSTDATNASNIGSGTLGLARGGTGADLSATGGAGKFLKQATLGAAVTVVQPACADLSNAAASCSTDATNASNISSGTLSVNRFNSGTGASSTTCLHGDGTWGSCGSANQALFNGYHGGDCTWTTTSTSFVDPIDDGSCTFVSLFNSSMGTVSSYGAKKPGIVISSAPYTGTMEVCSDVTLSPAASDSFIAALVDGGGSPIGYTPTVYGSNPVLRTGHVCGFYNVTASTSYTFKLQIKTASGFTGAIDGNGQTVSVAWSVKYVK